MINSITMNLRGIALCLIIGGSPLVGFFEDDTFEVGVAVADITPEELGWMAGYSARKGPAEKVLEPIFAKAITMEDGESNRLVIVTMDLIGVPRPFRDAIETALQSKFGLPGDALLINASHTHSGPMIRVYEPPGGKGEVKAAYENVPEEEQALRVKQTQDYLKFLEEKVIGIVDEAFKSAAPSTLHWSKSRCGFAINRRLPAEAGKWKNSPNPEGPIDHEVPVLQVKSREDGKLKAVLFGYSCHATVLSLMEISGDWPGYAQRYFEEDHPGVVAMFVNGCSGDQNPYPRRMLRFAQRHGQSMATAIEAALDTPSVALTGPLRSDLSWVDIAYQEPPGKETLERKAESADKYEARHAAFLLEILEEGGTLPTSYPVPVQVFRFGNEMTMATLGGEVVIDYSLRLKKELSELTGGKPVWVAGYSNDVMTYIPSERVLKEGGYEGGEAMRFARSTIHPAPWEPGIEDKLVGEIVRMTRALLEP
ncbi:neutral/alkaline non-lysosomal ceramidase N-terminal domain-containing protein [Verrucomicrobiales bacterium BCK34]|nr:neutral/alkaline non-lysosomal ceramidase N-terminal domain-containing protein [Verrucomicrobiales bacterium BCK34]